MIRQTYKFYLPDIIKLDKIEEISQKLNVMNPSKIYFGIMRVIYHKKKLKNLQMIGNLQNTQIFLQR